MLFGKHKKIELSDLFAIEPILRNLVFTTAIIVAFYFAATFNLLGDWLYTVYYALKIIIAYNILVGSMRSLWIPIITLNIAFLYYYFQFFFLVPSECIQLIFAGLTGFLITLIVKL